jgi:GDP-L-fucose synthase
MQRKNILVTGGAGFLGREVCLTLSDLGHTVSTFRSKEYDLRYKTEALRIIGAKRYDVVVHLAATCGGIGANMSQPGKYIRENLEMGVNVIEACRKSKVGSTIVAGTVCSYPKYCPAPFKEEDFWNGYPEETNAPYGIAKKTIFEMLKAYRAEYGMKSVSLLPANLYGPRDNFKDKSSHVVPALIKKFYNATYTGEPSVTVWGDGSATREFLHVRDAALGIAAAVEAEDHDEPINLGGGEEVSVGDLVKKITSAFSYKGKIIWDSSKPNGQPRRSLNSEQAAEILGWRPQISFDEGLQETIDWYKHHREK